MKTLKIFLLLILVAFLSNVYAQEDNTRDKTTTGKNKKQIKVKIHDIPKVMAVSSSADIIVTVTNKSKSETWTYSGDFTYTVEGPFTLTRTDLNTTKFSINHRERKDLTYKLTAPSEEGKHKVTIIFLNGDKKTGAKSKSIKVGSDATDNGKNKNKNKDKDKDKDKDKNKNKD